MQGPYSSQRVWHRHPGLYPPGITVPPSVQRMHSHFDFSDFPGKPVTDTWCPRLAVSAITETHTQSQDG